MVWGPIDPSLNKTKRSNLRKKIAEKSQSYNILNLMNGKRR